MTKLLVILNPWAGRGAAGRSRPALEQALRQAGVEHAIVATHARGGATELARAGGERARTIDLGRVQVDDGEPRYFINALGMGLDAQVAAESLKLTKLKGLAVYLVAIIRALASYKAHPMNVEYDGRRVHRRLLFASVANGRCQGGGFWLTPTAEIDDGLLDLCLVDNMRLDEIIRHFPKVLDGTHVDMRQVTMGRARTIGVACGAPIPVATDGEVISTDARRITAETVAGALEILV